MNARELLQRYAAGQRDFSRVTLIPEYPTSLNSSEVHLASLELVKDTAKSRKLTKAHLNRVFLHKSDRASEETIRECLVNVKTISCDLSGADLKDADFCEANLKGANLSSADLRGANLRRTNLQSADLRGANLIGVDLRKTKLKGANLKGAYLDETALQTAEATNFFVMY